MRVTLVLGHTYPPSTKAPITNTNVTALTIWGSRHLSESRNAHTTPSSVTSNKSAEQPRRPVIDDSAVASQELFRGAPERKDVVTALLNAVGIAITMERQALHNERPWHGE